MSEGERGKVRAVRVSGKSKWWVVDVCVCEREGAKVER